MAEPNDQLRRARERTESPHATGEALSRQELAELVNAWVYQHTEDQRVIELDANYIGKLEQGTIRWLRDPERRAAFRAVLGVTTDAELGSRRPRRSRTIVIGVERQRFLRVGLGVGAAAVAGPTALAALLPTQPTRVPSVVGMAQVAEVRAAAEAFAGWDARYGGGLMHEAVVAQLHYYAELLNARCCEAVRGELLTAVGSFAETAGYMADDDYAHDDARRMYRFALACAEEAGDWHLRAQVLCSMAFFGDRVQQHRLRLAGDHLDLPEHLRNPFVIQAAQRCAQAVETARHLLHGLADCGGHIPILADSTDKTRRSQPDPGHPIG